MLQLGSLLSYRERRCRNHHDTGRNEDVGTKNSWLLAQPIPICALFLHDQYHVLDPDTVSTLSIGKIYIVVIRNGL